MHPQRRSPLPRSPPLRQHRLWTKVTAFVIRKLSATIMDHHMECDMADITAMRS